MRARGVLGMLAAACLIAAADAPAAPGDLDPSFGKRGVVRGSLPTAAVEAGQGATILAGGATVRKLTSSGKVDRSFGDEGLAELPAEIAGIAADDQQRLMVVGKLTGSEQDPYVTRLLPDGRTDPSFEVDLAALSGLVPRWVAVQPSGRILVAGDRGEDAVVVALAEGGSPNTTFEASGEGIGFTMGADGSAFLALAEESTLTVHKLDANGEPAPAWGNNGSSSIGSSGSDIPYSARLVVDSHGRLAMVVRYDSRCGASCHGNSSYASMLMLDGDGARDTGWELRAGSLYRAAPRPDDRAFEPSSIAFDGDGRLLVGGDSTSGCGYGDNHCFSDAAVARLRPDGTIDRSFDRTWISIREETLAGFDTRSLLVQEDGRILGGTYDGVFRLLGSGRRHDRDADGVIDRKDRCRFVFGKRGGCPNIATDLTIKLTRFGFGGRVTSSNPGCVRRRDRGWQGARIHLKRVRPGRDRAFGRARAVEGDTWLLQKKPPPGRYYARILATPFRDVGICTAARTKTIRVP